MKRIFLSTATIVMVALIAVSAVAERPERDGDGPRAERMGRGPGHGFHGPDGPGGGRRGPGGPGRFIEKMIEGEMAEKLELEPGQIDTLKKGLERIRNKEEKLREKLQAAGKEQAELLQAEGEVDEEALMKAIEKTGRIRTQMAKLRVRPILLVKKTLTAEQLEAAHKMMRARMKKHREERDERGGRGKNRPRRWRDQTTEAAEE